MVVCGMLADAGSRNGCPRTMRPRRKVRQMGLTAETPCVELGRHRVFQQDRCAASPAQRLPPRKEQQPMHLAALRTISVRPMLFVAALSVALVACTSSP